MKQAPVVIMVLNEEAGSPFQNIQSIQPIGTAIQNMLLVTEDMVLGTLWIWVKNIHPK